MNLTEEGESPSDLAEALGDLVNDLQASHSTSTGDMSYTNSVRTGRIFNDPKLNQFRTVSQAWHVLAHLGGDSASKHIRTTSMAAEEPRSLAMPTITPRKWTLDEMQTALCRTMVLRLDLAPKVRQMP